MLRGWRFSHLRESAGVHGGGLDMKHHPVNQRLGARHKANPQAGGAEEESK